MKMKRFNKLGALCMLLCLSSCFQDETTDGTGPISEITIKEGCIKAVYDIDKNETLTISPVITQSYANKPVIYTWEIDQKVYSREQELIYVGKELGSFHCRLIVENEDGKTFFPFTLNVNSPYEEGITVISNDDDGNSMLSFMLKQRVEGVADHFTEGDCFALNNPEYTFTRNVMDVVQCDGSLILACQGDPAAGQSPAIYYLNDKTLVIENMISVNEFEDFRPYKILLPSHGTAGTIYPILCENGKVYELSPTEGAIGKPVKFKSEYTLCGFIYDSGAIAYNNVYLWDKKFGDVCMLYNGYGPYYCSKTYLFNPDVAGEEEAQASNYFKGYEPVFMFLPRTVGNTAAFSKDIVLITSSQKGMMYQKTIMDRNFWYYNEETLQNDLGAYGGPQHAGFSCRLTERTPHVATELYNYLLYGDGNKIVRWIYSQPQLLDNAKVCATVGSDRAVVTAMELSLDHTETFVAFYEPDEEGLNGHVWVLNTEDGTLLRQYDNICYRPTRIIYKKK
ncbi:MAG: hypothetical protein K2N13_07820 [Paraprevotella sp.]|nr:hypothetical protein [Paraprevotella sp.]